MRTEPTWRIPIGILGLLLALALYGIAIATWIAPAIEGWNALLQTLVYLVLGVLWLRAPAPFPDLDGNGQHPPA